MSFLAVFICYIDRVNISVAIIPMQEQFGWSEAQTGIIFSIFYIGYVLTMILGGILADKYGGKTVLGVGVLLWSIFTMLTPFFAYNGFLALLFIRVLIGLGEGILFHLGILYTQGGFHLMRGQGRLLLQIVAFLQVLFLVM